MIFFKFSTKHIFPFYDKSCDFFKNSSQIAKRKIVFKKFLKTKIIVKKINFVNHFNYFLLKICFSNIIFKMLLSVNFNLNVP